MKLTGRIPLAFLILGICLLSGILLRTYIQDYLVTPISLLLWLLWRYIESIDQAIYWSFLIVVIMAYVLYRVVQRSHFEEQRVEHTSNTILENLQYWRSLILFTGNEIDKPNMIKKDLGWMLAAFYAIKGAATDNNEAYNALKVGQIPLPSPIHKFLFSPEVSGSHRSIKQMVNALWTAPGRWILHWSGRDLQNYYQSIEEVLNFMDSMMETKNDDD